MRMRDRYHIICEQTETESCKQMWAKNVGKKKVRQSDIEGVKNYLSSGGRGLNKKA